MKIQKAVQSRLDGVDQKYVSKLEVAQKRPEIVESVRNSSYDPSEKPT
jgi:hypothetical protein